MARTEPIATITERSSTILSNQPSVVPALREQRETIRQAAHLYAAEKRLVPPLSLDELAAHARTLYQVCGFQPDFLGFAMLMLHNAVWWNRLAAIPRQRRLLLLPQCLRSRQRCRAATDEYGLVCEQCGNCPIGALQTEAEDLGYVTLVAEGTTMVTRLLEEGKIDAVIGVSCPAVLERAFPYATTQAIPSIAIPLLRDGCENTAVDEDWVREALRLQSDRPPTPRIVLDDLRRVVEEWFTPEMLDQILQIEGTPTEKIAVSWLAKAGKRWRPLLTISVFEALNGTCSAIPTCLRDLAVAVECFHKASLVHDDIEDEDSERYGEPTLHRQHGIAVALNVGDLLIGMGYRLIARTALAAEQKAQALAVAADGHRRLCVGQGEELGWKPDTTFCSVPKTIEIFRRKTAPAFEVALRFGAICAGADAETCRILSAFSEAIGIASQIRDDLEDLVECGVATRKPPLLLALAVENADAKLAQRLRTLACSTSTSNTEELRQLLTDLGIPQKTHSLLEQYRRKALQALAPVRNVELKSLLYRITFKILGGS
ncbi:MAG: polyprenyl synthetase family protein [Kiritimatiellia bacterium]